MNLVHTLAKVQGLQKPKLCGWPENLEEKGVPVLE